MTRKQYTLYCNEVPIAGFFAVFIEQQASMTLFLDEDRRLVVGVFKQDGTRYECKEIVVRR